MFEMACCRLGAGGLLTVNAEGSELTALTNGRITGIGNANALQVDGYYDPVWSPDGTKIPAGRGFLDDDGNFRKGFILLDGDGSDQHRVSSGFDDVHQPDWGTAMLQ